MFPYNSGMMKQQIRPVDGCLKYYPQIKKKNQFVKGIYNRLLEFYSEDCLKCYSWMGIQDHMENVCGDIVLRYYGDLPKRVLCAIPRF